MEYKGEYLIKIDNFIFVEELNEGAKYKDYLAKEIKLNDSVLRDKINNKMKIIKKSKDNIAHLFTVKKSTDYIFYFINEYYNGGNLQNFEKNYFFEKKIKIIRKIYPKFNLSNNFTITFFVQN